MIKFKAWREWNAYIPTSPYLGINRGYYLLRGSIPFFPWDIYSIYTYVCITSRRKHDQKPRGQGEGITKVTDFRICSRVISQIQ